MINKPLHITAIITSCLIVLTACTQGSGEAQSTAAVQTTTIAAPTPGVIEIKPVEIVEAAAKYLSAQPALSAGWFISYETQGDRDTPLRLTNTWNGENTLVRGKGYHVVCEHGDTVEEFRYDGATLTAINPGKDFYATTPISGSIDEMVATLQDEQNITMPAWELFSENVSDTLLSDINRAEYVGMTSILGQPVHHLSFSEPGQDWEIWISTDASNPMPLMMAGNDPDVEYSGYQAIFHDWETKPDAMQTPFTFEPPEGLKKIDFSAINDPDADNK